MNESARWIAAALTIAVLVLYEIWFAMAQRRQPNQLARAAHAKLREDWFEAVSQSPGSEVLAVQTLRNSVMSASIIASTAVLALTGIVTLSTSSLGASMGGNTTALEFTPRIAVELVLLALLFSSLVASVMAVRYYHHSGFVGGMPVDCHARQRWNPVGAAHIRRAGIFYSWSLRSLFLVAPPIAFILHPVAGPVAAALVVMVLHRFDRVPDSA